MNLLFVEDEPLLRFLYRMEFELDGYVVFVAASATEALEILTKHKIDGVIMELALPDMNGLRLIDAMLARCRFVPIIINTASPRLRDDFHCWGAEAFITKSSDLTLLKDAVAHHVGHARAAHKYEAPSPFVGKPVAASELARARVQCVE